MGNLAASRPPRRAHASSGPASPPAGSSIADALFTASQQRVLFLLFGQPERSFFTKELIELAGGGSGAVQRELARLQHSGLIVQSTVGNRKHYQANAQAPIFSELRDIVAKILAPADTLRQALAPLADALQLALLYGSAAQRSDTAYSDFDLLLVSDTLQLEQVYTVLASAEQRLGRPVNPTLYTQDEFNQRLAKRNPFLTKVLTGNTIVLFGDHRAVTAAG